MILPRGIQRVILGTGILTACVFLALLAISLLGIARGRSGRGDILTLASINAALVFLAAFLCRARLRWSGIESFTSLLVFECLVWIATAWIFKDGSVAYLLRFEWTHALFEKSVLSYLLYLNLFIALPWICGLAVARLAKR